MCYLSSLLISDKRYLGNITNTTAFCYWFINPFYLQHSVTTSSCLQLATPCTMPGLSYINGTSSLIYYPAIELKKSHCLFSPEILPEISGFLNLM